VETTLMSAGLACLIAAIVGGGLKAFGIEMPVLGSIGRQVLLAGLGGVLVISGARSDLWKPDSGPAVTTPAPRVSPEPQRSETGSSANPQAPQTTEVVRSEQDQIQSCKWATEGPGLAAFDVSYTYDPAHKDTMYARVTVLTGRTPIAQGLMKLPGPSGDIRVEARKKLGQPTESEYVECALFEGTIPVRVIQFSFKRLWGP
jgi:hypothetical protein